MRKNWLLGLAVCALAVGAATPAHADFNIATGLKWVPLRYTSPAFPSTGASGAAAYGWQTTSLDNYVAFFFTEQVGLQLSLDLGYASHHTDDGNGNTTDASYFQFGVGVGGKFYLNRPTRERVSPYLFVNLFKYFASESSSDSTVTNDVAAALAAAHSPIGFDLAFGAEYFFTTSFSLGAEVLGLRYAYINSTIQSASSSYGYFTFYTGISLNYRFLATASVRTYEEEEDQNNPRPAKRPRPRPRPTPVEPPPDENPPESVD